MDKQVSEQIAKDAAEFAKLSRLGAASEPEPDGPRTCDSCGRPFTRRKVAYLRRRYEADSWGEGITWSMHAYCATCVRDRTKWHPSWWESRGEPVRCVTCGQLIAGFKGRWGDYRPPKTCSWGCARNRPRSHVTPTPHTCDTCGLTFTPTRSDARYCSPACRQRAYRTRRAAPAASPRSSTRKEGRRDAVSVCGDFTASFSPEKSIRAGRRGRLQNSTRLT